MDKFEKDIINRFSNISDEDMNTIINNTDPSEFECSPKLKSEIEDIVMSKTKLKKTKNNKIKLFISMAACAILIITGSILLTNTSVQAALAKLFTYAPRHGVVEVEPNDTVLKLEDNTSDETNISTGSMDLSIISAYTLEDKLTVEYQAVLTGTSLQNVEGFLDCDSFPEQINLIKEYLIDMGYDKYFDFPEGTFKLEEEIFKNPISSVAINGTEYKGKFESIDFASEYPTNFTMTLVQSYDVPRDVYQNITIIDFTFGDITTTLSLTDDHSYIDVPESTAPEASSNGNIVESDGIKIEFEPTLTKNELIIDGYVLEKGGYDMIMGLEAFEQVREWTSGTDSDNEYRIATLHVGDKKIEAYLKEDDTNNKADNALKQRYYFDISDIDLNEDIYLEIYGLCAVKSFDEKLVLPIDKTSDEIYNIPNAHVSNISVTYINEYPYMDCDIDNYDDNVIFSDFFEPKYDNENVTLSAGWYAVKLNAEIPLNLNNN